MAGLCAVGGVELVEMTLASAAWARELRIFVRNEGWCWKGIPTTATLGRAIVENVFSSIAANARRRGAQGATEGRGGDASDATCHDGGKEERERGRESERDSEREREREREGESEASTRAIRIRRRASTETEKKTNSSLFFHFRAAAVGIDSSALQFRPPKVSIPFSFGSFAKNSMSLHSRTAARGSGSLREEMRETELALRLAPAAIL